MYLHKTSNYFPSIVLKFNVHFSLKIFARFFCKILDQAKSCLNFFTFECDLLREKCKQEKYCYFLVGNKDLQTPVCKRIHNLIPSSSCSKAIVNTGRIFFNIAIN